MKSKPSDCHRCACKKKHSPLFLYILICHSLFWLQHCLCICLQRDLDTVGSMQTVRIKTFSLPFVFQCVCVLSTQESLFSGSLYWIPWIVEWYRYESSDTAHQPLLGSGAGVQCSNEPHCYSVGKWPQSPYQYAALFLSYCFLKSAVCLPHKSVMMSGERPVEFQKD